MDVLRWGFSRGAAHGPVEAVRHHCEKFVVVVQGDSKPSDLAKILQKQLGGELDEIIRALPSGGWPTSRTEVRRSFSYIKTLLFQDRNLLIRDLETGSMGFLKIIPQKKPVSGMTIQYSGASMGLLDNPSRSLKDNRSAGRTTHDVMTEVSLGKGFLQISRPQRFPVSTSPWSAQPCRWSPAPRWRRFLLSSAASLCFPVPSTLRQAPNHR